MENTRHALQDTNTEERTKGRGCLDVSSPYVKGLAI